MNHPICPLCDSQSSQLLCETNRPYWHCQNCDLVFVPKAYHLNHQDERAIYECHENNPQDAGYRQFLSRLMTPLLDVIPAGSKGLDFGSGPGPTLSIMLQETGHDMHIFDPYFANDPSVLTQTYDFVTSTEVVEHLADPKQIFDQLVELVDKRGPIGIMTKLIPDFQGFAKWHYIKDPTHITFYSEQTFEYIAQKYTYRANILRNDVIILIPDK